MEMQNIVKYVDNCFWYFFKLCICFENISGIVLMHISK